MSIRTYDCLPGMYAPPSSDPIENPTRLAVFSHDRVYRYVLLRDFVVNPQKRLVVIGLNPSTADETNDDPTIRRCRDFAVRFGCDGLAMLNLFAYRATDPKVMKAVAEPIGDRNDYHLCEWSLNAKGPVIAAWGVHGVHMDRGAKVLKMLYREGVEVSALGFTKDGHPRHPLYLPSSSQPIPVQNIPGDHP